jgi:hypothetical protein
MKVERKGNTVIITVELEKNPKPSSTGKSLVLYTSHGFKWTEDLGINLTIIKSR